MCTKADKRRQELRKWCIDSALRMDENGKTLIQNAEEIYSWVTGNHKENITFEEFLTGQPDNGHRIEPNIRNYGIAQAVQEKSDNLGI